MRFFLLVCLVPLIASKAANRSPCNPNELDCGENSCFPMFYEGNNGSKCFASCPVTCNEGEMHCPGVQDPVTGCMNPDTCIPGSAGMCTSFCPITCGPEETMCPGKIDETSGCAMDPGHCVPVGTEC